MVSDQEIQAQSEGWRALRSTRPKADGRSRAQCKVGQLYPDGLSYGWSPTKKFRRRAKDGVPFEAQGVSAAGRSRAGPSKHKAEGRWA